MAFDYGSIDLGLRNPFKAEGKVTAVRGAIQILLALILLIQAASRVGENPVYGWILVLFGVAMLALGIRSLSGGILAVLRYFVGRNHPTSLARNFSKSEASTAKEEAAFVAYTSSGLEEMLMGRKNATFVEPAGFLARLLHTVLPKLLFMPYPIRTMAQRLFGAWVKTLTAIVAYGLVAFVSLAGFAGESGKLIFPIYSTVLTLYLVLIWSSAAMSTPRSAERGIPSLGGAALVKVIALSIIAPVLIGVGLSFLSADDRTLIASVLSDLPSLHPLLYIFGVLIAATACSFLVVVMLRARLAIASPTVEVSELRENWQESVHPNEIFINLDNLVMANRRYKEVPNRVYIELDPKLNEQVQGKGDFKGQMIQEVQPKVKPMDLGASFQRYRFISLLAGNGLYVLASVLFFVLAYSAVGVYEVLRGSEFPALSDGLPALQAAVIRIVGEFMPLVHLILVALIVRAFARLLAAAVHVFYAEFLFESLLVYFRCEGTFTESKVSTGKAIYDSTQSENTLVRSSITPWVIVSKIVSSTFAATGIKNLEHPRYILEMNKSESELQAIRSDVISFLKDRESIASITSDRDLQNASQIHAINQQTRAVPVTQNISDDAAGGYIQQQREAEKETGDDGSN